MSFLALLRDAFAPRRPPRRRATRRPALEILEDRACPSSLAFSTFLGGGADDVGARVAVDAAGNSYVGGRTASADFPVTTGAFDTSANGDFDGFVAKFDAGGSLLWATYLGGSGEDAVSAITTDAAGNVYVQGYTRSANFPATSSAAQPNYAGGQSDAFVAKLDSSGAALVYATFLGGGGDEDGRGIAVDGAGNAYLTGATNSSDFPTVSALQGHQFNGNCPYVAKLNADGSALVYSTYLNGSNGSGSGIGIAVDAAGNAYVAGSTNATDFPTVNAVQVTNHGGADVFVAQLNADGSALVYSTYLGGSGDEGAHEIVLDGAGNTYVTGVVSSTDFPTVNPFQSTNGGDRDAFVFKLDPSGSALVYSTYLGGSGYDETESIAVDGAGYAFVAGEASSSNFPTSNAMQATFGGGSFDGFLTQLTPSGAGVVFSTYLGGSDYDSVNGLAVDNSGAAYLVGHTGSVNFPTARAFQPADAGGPHDAFVAKITANPADTTPPVTTITLNGTAGSNGWYVSSVMITLTATDPDDAPATLTTYYAIDGGLPQTYAGPVAISSNGVHNIIYFSQDMAGNIEAAHSQTIRIDTTASLITATASQTTLWPANGKMVAVTVTGTIADNLAGIDLASASYTTVDSYGQVQPSGSIAVNGDGTFSFQVDLEARRNGRDRAGRTYTIVITAQDLAGNVDTITIAIVVPHDRSGK